MSVPQGAAFWVEGRKKHRCGHFLFLWMSSFILSLLLYRVAAGVGESCRVEGGRTVFLSNHLAVRSSISSLQTCPRACMGSGTWIGLPVRPRKAPQSKEWDFDAAASWYLYARAGQCHSDLLSHLMAFVCVLNLLQQVGVRVPAHITQAGLNPSLMVWHLP